MATHSSTLAWKIPRTEEPGRLRPWGRTESDMTERLHFHFIFPGGSEVKVSASNEGDPGSITGSGRFPGEGNGNPLQYSCLENPMDGKA